MKRPKSKVAGFSEYTGRRGRHDDAQGLRLRNVQAMVCWLFEDFFVFSSILALLGIHDPIEAPSRI